jgi:hypothetical protein
MEEKHKKNKVIQDLIQFEKRRIGRLSLHLIVGLLAATLVFFPIMALVEYWFYLSPTLKSIVLISYFGLVLAGLIKWVIIPWWKLNQTQSLEQFEGLSRQVSARVSQVDDKLTNYIQLLILSMKGNNSLVGYSLSQKQEFISQINIPKQISISIPTRLLQRLGLFSLLGIGISIGFFDRVKEGSSRLMHVNAAYTPPAPFQFQISEIPNKIMANQAINIQVRTSGPAIPTQVWIKLGSRTLKMEGQKNGLFVQKLEGLDPGKYEVMIFSGSVQSPVQSLEVLPPGQIEELKIKITPPAYTKKPSEILENEGNLEIPFGSRVEWNIKSAHVEKFWLTLGKSESQPFSNSSENQFQFASPIKESTNYQIKGINSLGTTDQNLNYSISIVEDQFPKIQVSTFQDSISLSRQYFAGRIADDYGFSHLKAQILEPSSKKLLGEAAINISKTEKNQSFIYLPEGKLAQIISEKPVVLQFKIWDNDGVIGPKATTSQTFDLKETSKNQITEAIDRMDSKNEKNLEDLVKKTESLEKNSKKMLENLKGKKELNWQDKKELENYVEKQKDLFKQIEDLKKEAEKVLNNKKENELFSEELLEKQEQINKMLDEILDEKTKEMLKELEKLLEQQNQNKDQLQDAFEKMQDKNEFIQNELDRAMEMLKQLKLEEKLEKTVNDLEKLAEKQEKAGDQNEKNGDQQSKDQKQEAQKEQKEMNEMFKQVQEDVKQLKELNNDLKEKNDIDSGEQEQKDVEQNQKESMDQMQQNKMQKAGGNQKKAASKMKKMAGKMKESLMEMQGGGADKEDIGDLRAIIENLLQLSFDQEEVYKEVGKVNQQDPRYLALTQKQVKIKDDSQVIKDSLKALAMRAPEIQSFVMKELFSMDAAIEEAVKYVKARRPDISSGKGQQAMTNINNLTVMLKDALQQMQQQQQQSQSGSKSCKKPGKGKPKPGEGKPKPGSMGQMQKQINEQIQKLKNGQKPGQGMSEELAKLAQKQAAMRRALGELEKSLQKGKDKSGGLGDVKSQMEKTERELLNKKLTPETIMRQQQILTRLLESEKALMEREQDQRRESEKPKSTERTTLPAEIKDLIRKSQAQKEQLMQGAPKLTEMYQQAYESYFDAIQEKGL